MNLRNVGARHFGHAPPSQFAIDEEHEARRYSLCVLGLRRTRTRSRMKRSPKLSTVADADNRAANVRIGDMTDAVRLYVRRSRSARCLHGVSSWTSRTDWCVDYAVGGLVWAAANPRQQ